MDESRGIRRSGGDDAEVGGGGVDGAGFWFKRHLEGCVVCSRDDGGEKEGRALVIGGCRIYKSLRTVTKFEFKGKEPPGRGRKKVW